MKLACLVLSLLAALQTRSFEVASVKPVQLGAPNPAGFGCHGADGTIGPTNTEAPTPFTLIQEQLGLRLEPAKVSAEYLVIESVEKPSGY